jgi:hypothetical protein
VVGLLAQLLCSEGGGLLPLKEVVGLLLLLLRDVGGLIAFLNAVLGLAPIWGRGGLCWKLHPAAATTALPFSVYKINK